MVKALPRPASETWAPALQAPSTRRVLRTYGLSRLLVLAAAFVATLTSSDPGAGPWPRIPGPHIALLRTLARWDSAWYLDIAQHGYQYWVSYQPASRFWPFQWIEGGWLLALSVLLIGATVWLVRRRAS